MTTVSILIPAFNRSQFIADCIQSALSQTYTDFEVVIVDNASDDGTWEICQRFTSMDSRVRIFRNNTNVGPVRNWMRCAELARGVYSKILFSDDMLEIGCLAVMVPSLDDPAVGLVYCAALIGETRSDAKVAYFNLNIHRITPDEFLNLVLQGRAPVSPGAVLLRTDDLRNNLHLDFPTSSRQPFEQHGAGPDVMLLLLTAYNYQAVEHINRPLVYFRAHEASFSVSNKNNQVSHGYRAAISYFLFAKKNQAVWIRYLARQWLSDIKRTRTLTAPRVLLRSLEGCGDIREQIALIYEAALQVLGRVLHFERRFI